MKKHIKTITIITGTALLLVSGIWLIIRSLQPKTAFVDLVLVYNDFKLKQELDNKLQTVQLKRKNILDSANLELNAISQRAQFSQPDTAWILMFEQKRQQYLYQQQQFEQDNNKTAELYQEQIWKQLNQYVQDYGKQHGYAYIFGGEGSGAVMYADHTNDITEDVKIYVNSRYKGHP